VTGDTDMDDVLESFALEAEGDATALARYLRDYPQYALALVDLSHEMAQSMLDEAAPPSPRDEAQIASAWTRFAAMVPTTIGTVQDQPVSVFDGRSAAEMKTLATALGVPRQVVAAVRDRRVLVDTIPKGFLARMAAGIDAHLEDLMASIGGVRSATLAPSYKADTRPVLSSQVPFERILIDAGVTEETRAGILAEID
jgi:hypothetical protein